MCDPAWLGLLSLGVALKAALPCFDCEQGEAQALRLGPRDSLTPDSEIIRTRLKIETVRHPLALS